MWEEGGVVAGAAMGSSDWSCTKSASLHGKTRSLPPYRLSQDRSPRGGGACEIGTALSGASRVHACDTRRVVRAD